MFRTLARIEEACARLQRRRSAWPAGLGAAAAMATLLWVGNWRHPHIEVYLQARK